MPENPQKYYMISIATKTTLTIKNAAHLTIGVNFNVSFMRNKSFYETFLNFSHFFSQITNLKMQIYFIFQALCGLKVSIVLSKF